MLNFNYEVLKGRCKRIYKENKKGRQCCIRRRISKWKEEEMG